MTNTEGRVEHGETYEHAHFGEIEVLELTAPIAALGPDGPERNNFVKFTTEVGADAVRNTKIHTRPYEKFVEGLV